MTQTDKQAQPTPGPWTVDALTNGFAVSSKGTDAPWPPHVADVWREADARLIAAAPRMLDLVNYIATEFQCGCDAMSAAKRKRFGRCVSCDARVIVQEVKGHD